MSDEGERRSPPLRSTTPPLGVIPRFNNDPVPARANRGGLFPPSSEPPGGGGTRTGFSSGPTKDYGWRTGGGGGSRTFSNTTGSGAISTSNPSAFTGFDFQRSSSMAPPPSAGSGGGATISQNGGKMEGCSSGGSEGDCGRGSSGFLKGYTKQSKNTTESLNRGASSTLLMGTSPSDRRVLRQPPGDTRSDRVSSGSSGMTDQSAADWATMQKIRILKRQKDDLEEARRRGNRRREGSAVGTSSSVLLPLTPPDAGPSTSLPPIAGVTHGANTMRGKRGHDNDSDEGRKGELLPRELSPPPRSHREPPGSRPKPTSAIYSPPKAVSSDRFTFDDDIQMAIALSLSTGDTKHVPQPKVAMAGRSSIVDVDLSEDEKEDDGMSLRSFAGSSATTAGGGGVVVKEEEFGEDLLQNQSFVENQHKALEKLRKQQAASSKSSASGGGAAPSESVKRRSAQEHLDARIARQMGGTTAARKQSQGRGTAPQMVAEGIDPEVIQELLAQGVDPETLGITVQQAPRTDRRLSHDPPSHAAHVHDFNYHQYDDDDYGDGDDIPPAWNIMGGIQSVMRGDWAGRRGGGVGAHQHRDLDRLIAMQSNMIYQTHGQQQQQGRRGPRGGLGDLRQGDVQQDMSYEALLDLEDVPTPLPAHLLRQIPSRSFKSEPKAHVTESNPSVTEGEEQQSVDAPQQDDDAPHCTICLMPYEEGDEVATLPDCLHEFHKDCVTEWFKGKKHCCVCKVEVGSQSQF